MSDKSVNNYDGYHNDEASDTDDYSKDDPTGYYRTLPLRHFAARPLEMLTDHEKLLEKCVEADNPEAHYIEGLLRYFHHKEELLGLRHLRNASVLNNKNGTYAHGLLMLLDGNYSKGIKFLDKLHWRHKLARANRCWERMKNSLRDMQVLVNRETYRNYVNLQPRTVCCDPDNMDDVCGHCYYYKDYASLSNSQTKTYQVTDNQI